MVRSPDRQTHLGTRKGERVQTGELLEEAAESAAPHRVWQGTPSPGRASKHSLFLAWVSEAGVPASCSHGGPLSSH